MQIFLHKEYAQKLIITFLILELITSQKKHYQPQ